MSTDLSTQPPPEEMGVCPTCKVEFRRKDQGQQYCCNAHGSPQVTADAPHSADCRRWGTAEFFKDPTRRFRIEDEAGEILWKMETDVSGSANIGPAVLSYKGALLNYKAATKLANYTIALVVLTGIYVLATIANIYVTLMHCK